MNTPLPSVGPRGEERELMAAKAATAAEAARIRSSDGTPKRSVVKRSQVCISAAERTCMEAIVVHEGERPGKREAFGLLYAVKRVYRLKTGFFGDFQRANLTMREILGLKLFNGR
jgi:hypothetical protein